MSQPPVRPVPQSPGRPSPPPPATPAPPPPPLPPPFPPPRPQSPGGLGQQLDPATAPGDLTQALIDTDIWTDEMVARAGIPIIDTRFVTVGGGIGSFVTVDYLRIYGVPASDITVLTQLETPWSSYEYLTRVSQIPRGERLRSDSKSTPDNIWGFPSYAVREALATKSVKDFVRSWRPRGPVTSTSPGSRRSRVVNGCARTRNRRRTISGDSPATRSGRRSPRSRSRTSSDRCGT